MASLNRVVGVSKVIYKVIYNSKVIYNGAVPFCKRFTSSSSLIDVREEEGVRHVVMTDVNTRNSLSLAMVSCLRTAMTENTDDPRLRCIVLSAEGKVFSAGHNLKELATPQGKEVFSHFSKLMMSMTQCPVPVISAVDGLAAAAGCQMVSQTDIILCTERSSFSTPGANFGIFCSTPGVAVARAVPHKMAAYMLLTGLPISSADALRFGLVYKVSKDRNELDMDLKVVTDSIKAKSRPVVELGKRIFYKQLQQDLPKAYEIATSAMVQNVNMPDGEEGLKSFMEKRKPVWSK